MFGAPIYVESGGLMAYGVNYPDSYRRAAGYVAQILNAADLPIQRPTTFDFIVNLVTAQALGLTLPESILAKITGVIR